MTLSMIRALPALAIGGAAFLFVAPAQAATVTFASTVSFTETLNKVSLSSSGLNATLTVGVSDTITDFAQVTVGTGTWDAFSALSAVFTFTTPTASGTTADTSGAIAGSQVNGSSKVGSLNITWDTQPVEFDFADGTKLAVTLGDVSESCSGNNCIAGTYDMSATFLVLSGPTQSEPGPTPLPAALPIFASGLGVFGLLARRRKGKARFG